MQTKNDLFDAGMLRASDFLKRNRILIPIVRKSSSLTATGDYTSAGGGKVRINVDRSATPTKNPDNYRWSFPGYKIDRTPYGVVAHEFGHHVDATLDFPSRRLPRGWKQKRISGYEPNNAESFAETMKLFITNPDLLRAGAPIRYRYLQKLDLVAVDDMPWRDVLAGHGANERLLDAADHWINRN